MLSGQDPAGEVFLKPMAGGASDEAIVAVDNVEWAGVAWFEDGGTILGGGVRLFGEADESALVEVVKVAVVAVPVGVDEHVVPAGMLEGVGEVVEDVDGERSEAAPGGERDAIGTRGGVATMPNGVVDILATDAPRVVVGGQWWSVGAGAGAGARWR